MKKFWLNCFLATVFVFGVLWTISKIAQFSLLNVFDPLGQAIGDMDITDIAFSSLRIKETVPDSNIVLVNIGNLPRAGIAEQIRIINSHKPKIIGIDSFFFLCGNNSCSGELHPDCCPQAFDTLSNTALASAIAEAGNVVLVNRLQQTEELVRREGDVLTQDTVARSDPRITAFALDEGFANLDTSAEEQEDLKTCRRFFPKLTMADGSVEYAFAVKVAMRYDSTKTAKFLARNKFSEVINYRRNGSDPHHASHPAYSNKYISIDWYQVGDSVHGYDPKDIKDKIVLLGYMGASMEDTSWDDKFITPLNKKYAGKTRPDMYGVVVHANIISMILDEEYIGELAQWQEYALSFIVCFFNVYLFMLIVQRIPHWYDGVSLLLQLIQIVICTFLMIYVLHWFNFKLNLTYTLASLALVGTCFELYNGVVLQVWRSIKRKIWITRSNEEVLIQ